MALPPETIHMIHDMDQAIGAAKRHVGNVVEDLQDALKALHKGKTVVVEERLEYSIELLLKTIAKLHNV